MSLKVLKMLCVCDSLKKGPGFHCWIVGENFNLFIYFYSPYAHPILIFYWKPSISKKESWEVRAETSQSPCDDGVVPKDDALFFF